MVQEFVYRVMIEDPDEKNRPLSPLIGETHLTLGPRVPWDVTPDPSNYIHQNGKDGKPQGITVYPNTSDIPAVEKPSEFGGTGQFPVWQLPTKILAAHQLAALPPGDKSKTLVLATLKTVSWPEYWYRLAQTQPSWTKAKPPKAKAKRSRSKVGQSKIEANKEKTD